MLTLGTHHTWGSNAKDRLSRLFSRYLGLQCSKHMTGNALIRKLCSKFLCTVRFRNENIAKIIGYGDYQLGNVTISRVYYIKGLRHNLFSVGQFCDADLEVAFQKNTCFIHNLEAMASEQFSSGPGLHYLSPATSSSGLVPNTLSQQPCIPPNKDDWDHFFQPMFNEHFTPPSIVVSLVQEATALRAVDLAESPVSTSIDQRLLHRQVEVMRKHGYGYLKEIIIRRADNDLYRFKEGDFPRLRINNIKDMLLLVVQN
ncbi:hypothetical protein Tco_1577152 [Tanacetum coccineum]